MPKLNRCPRCSDRRIPDRRYCPNCAFDYDQGLGPSRGSSAGASAWVTPRGETGLGPGAPRILDPSLYQVPTRDDDVENIRRDVARVALARHSVSVRSRIGGCLGMVGGLVIAGIVVPLFAGANWFLLPFVIGVLIIVGGWIGSFLVVRSLAD
jgi:hypothetical protein